MKRSLTLLVILFSISALNAQITIAEARSLPEGSAVTVKGLVLNGSELGDVRYIQDATGNIATFNTSMLDDVLRGDSILVSGPLSDYNGLLEISSTTSVTVINSGNALPAALVISCSSGYIEANEGKLVKVEDAEFTETGTFSTAGSGTNYDITDAGGTAEVRVVTTTNIDGTPIPSDAVSITGIMSQYDPSGVGGYQLLPRDLGDIAPPGNPPVISTVLSQTNITTSSFTVNFSTLYEGNTIIYYGLTNPPASVTSDAALTTSHALDITGLTAGTIYYVQAASVSTTNDTSWSAVAPMATASNSTGAMHIWFNGPVDNSVSTGTNAEYVMNMDDSIIYYMDHAKYSMDIAIYNIDNVNNIITAINDAYLRGVAVRVICDSGVNDDYDLINVGSGNKKKSPTGTTSSGEYYGIMHDKFVVIDAVSANANDPWVLGGSSNMTDQQVKIDHQNMIVIQDQSLARAYEIEFNEMWGGKFGPDKTNNTPHEFMIGGKRVEQYFSPSDDVETHIIDQINKADHDLYFMIYTFTRFGISYAIQDAVEDRGVFAAGDYDETDAVDTTAISICRDVMGEAFRKHVGSELLHHKYLIIDATCPAADPIVLTGSHNWSSSANSRNDENTLIVHDSTIANVYYQEWRKRYQEDGGSLYVSEACTYVGVQPELQISNEIRMYPNPADHYIFIESDQNYSGTISILNMNGELLYLGNMSGVQSTIDVSGLPQGVYIISFNNAQSHITKKFIKE